MPFDAIERRAGRRARLEFVVPLAYLLMLLQQVVA